jgi:hypothetical protein
MTPNCSRARVLLTATTGRIWHRWKQGDQIGRIFVHRTNFFFTQLLIKITKVAKTLGHYFPRKKLRMNNFLPNMGLATFLVTFDEFIWSPWFEMPSGQWSFIQVKRVVSAV